ncbi:MAG: hypothetical protein GXO05_01395 [Aquificae bacterium]|nr:hypothetical protein [Aquificota bacterium]
MRKLLAFTVVISAFIFACGTAGKTAKTAQQEKPQKPEVKPVTIKGQCKNYVTRMEKCLQAEKGKDYRVIWSRCEGQVMWDMLKEYEDNGFCFDEDECKQKILEEINNCKEERNYLFRKYYR